jgi:uncharacterized membrane protein
VVMVVVKLTSGRFSWGRRNGTAVIVIMVVAVVFLFLSSKNARRRSDLRSSEGVSGRCQNE